MTPEEFNAHVKRIVPVDASNWQPTAHLRTLKYKYHFVQNGQEMCQHLEKLQQLWSDGCGKTEWRDVEVVSEGKA